MSLGTASAILRGKWLIEPIYAQTQLPLILEMMKGGHDKDVAASLAAQAASNTIPHNTRLLPTAGLKSSSIYAVNPYTNLDRLPYESIAVINVIGPVTKYGDWCSWGSMEQTDLLIKLSESPRVKGILINLDTPGGQVDGTATLAETIRMISRKKPVLGIIQDGMAASAGIWIGSAVQELYATRVTDMIGSIGAYCSILDFTEYFAANGIKILDIYAPQSDDKNGPYKEALKGNDLLIKEDLKFCVEQFIGDVTKYRSGRLNTKKEDPFTGKLYNAKQALSIGLIDGIKPLSGVIARLEQLIQLRA